MEGITTTGTNPSKVSWEIPSHCGVMCDSAPTLSFALFADAHFTRDLVLDASRHVTFLRAVHAAGPQFNSHTLFS